MTAHRQEQAAAIRVPSIGQKRRSHLYRAAALIIAGAMLLLWAKPVAAAVTITEFKVNTVGVLQSITAGSDGNLWFTLDDTSEGSEIGRITPSGAIIRGSPLPGSDYVTMSGITAGPDGNLWFTYQDWNTNESAIGRITTSGVITLFPTPTANSGSSDITTGPDGNLWFTESIGQIGCATTS